MGRKGEKCVPKALAQELKPRHGSLPVVQALVWLLLKWAVLRAMLGHSRPWPTGSVRCHNSYGVLAPLVCFTCPPPQAHQRAGWAMGILGASLTHTVSGAGGLRRDAGASQSFWNQRTPNNIFHASGLRTFYLKTIPAPNPWIATYRAKTNSM